MAFQFVAVAHYDNGSSTSAVVAKPTGTTNNDLMFAVTKHNANETATTVPSGWAQLGVDRWIGGAQTVALYYKLAASEGSDYTWGWATTARTSVSIVTYRDGFNTSDPIDVVSDTTYSADNTTLRAASMTVSAADSPLIFFGLWGLGSLITATPPTVPTTFTENVDYWETNGRGGRAISSVIWTGSGATGDMDATVSSTPASAKHAFAVALNPFTGSGGIPRAAMYYNRRD